MAVIKLIKRNHKVSIQHKRKVISIQHVGRKGPKGNPGTGIPSGGTQGQVLTKKSNQDFDIEFTDLGTLADKNYEQTFGVSTTVTVNHGLNKYASSVVFDSAGDEVECDVVYVNKNTLKLLFSAPFSGRVSCN